jgi:pseudaminic acid synthase
MDKDKIFIVAELSANHNQRKEVAIDTIKAAKRAGADAIKLQTYTPDTITIDCDNEYFQIKEGLWKGKTLYELYQEAYTPWEWHEELFEIARNEGLICFSAPFDTSAVDFLENLDNPIYKIASFEIQDIPLIKYAAGCGKPMIISTGIANLEDIDRAVRACRETGNDDITLLWCTSVYPTPLKGLNLATIPNLKETFNVEVGLSDHTKGTTVPVVATTFGAKIIEKHFILDKSLGGPDAAFSLDSDEFSEMVDGVRNATKSIGAVSYELSEEVKLSRLSGRSLFAVQDIKKGERFTRENVRSIRPGYGLKPEHLDYIVGKRASSDIKKGQPMNWSFIEG